MCIRYRDQIKEIGADYWPNMLAQSCINSVLSRLPSRLVSNICIMATAVCSSTPIMSFMT